MKPAHHGPERDTDTSWDNRVTFPKVSANRGGSVKKGGITYTNANDIFIPRPSGLTWDTASSAQILADISKAALKYKTTMGTMPTTLVTPGGWVSLTTSSTFTIKTPPVKWHRRWYNTTLRRAWLRLHRR